MKKNASQKKAPLRVNKDYELDGNFVFWAFQARFLAVILEEVAQAQAVLESAAHLRLNPDGLEKNRSRHC